MPPNPKALTAARRGSPPRAPLGRARFGPGAPPRASGLPSGGQEKCSVGGRTRWCMASSARMVPAAPAAVSRCPIMDLTEPIVHGRGRPRRRPAAPPGSPVRCGPRRRARAVALDVIHVARRPACGVVGGAHGPQLAFGVRREEVPAQVVRKPDAPDQPEDGVPVGQGVLQAFQEQQPGAFADHETVGAAVERGAAAAGRQRLELAEPDLGEQGIRPGHPAGQHGIRAAGTQLVACELDGIKRGGAGGVQGVGRTAEAERLSQHRGRAARSRAWRCSLRRRSASVAGGSARPVTVRASNGLEEIAGQVPRSSRWAGRWPPI